MSTMPSAIEELRQKYRRTKDTWNDFLEEIFAEDNLFMEREVVACTRLAKLFG